MAKKQVYDHGKIEKKWQKKWETSKIYKTDDKTLKLGQKKFYVLDMFPYPSGEGLHVGHPKGYIATDVVSRMKRMSGFKVLHPMGWDAFGLPAEQFAIKNKTNPMIGVKKTVARFKKQVSIIGLDYDWDREINTTDPKYYKWTQWTFLKMLEAGLAYESHEPINWCPSCKTGLANEDVEDGKCERCGTPVEKKPLRQWVIKITKYADRLLNDLEALEWPEPIKDAQRNWIGRSEGAEVTFKTNTGVDISVFTTRVDTLFGVTYVVVAPESKLIAEFGNNIKNQKDVAEFIKNTSKISDIERTAADKPKNGLKLEGVVAINPANNEEVPVFIADYVLANYGTGAVMVVPAHDTRDYAFAKKYNLPIREVIIPERVDLRNPPRKGKETVERQNIHAIVKNKKGEFLCLKWNKFNWLTFPMGGVEKGEDVVEAARREVAEETGYKNLKLVKVLGGQVRAEYFAAHKDQNRTAFTTAVLFDLIDDEQGEITDENDCDVLWLSKEKVTTENMTHAEMDIWLKRLVDMNDMSFVDDGVLINSAKFTSLKSEEARGKIAKAYGKLVTKYKLRDWVFSRQRYWGEPIPVIHCAKCGVVPVPYKDLPVVLPKVKSYEPTGTGESPLANILSWVNVKCPKCKGPGKRETNTMPQWAGSSWYYLRYMDPKNDKALVDPKKEAFWSPVDFYVGGAEHAARHLIYARFWHKFLQDIGVVKYSEPFKKLQNVGLIMGEDGRKMSKRYGNVVNPDTIVETYGADTLRLYEMFMGPFDQEITWKTDNIIGVRRFLERVWRMHERVVDDKKTNAKKGVAKKDAPGLENATEILFNQTIKKVTDDINTLGFNTAISQMMILVNQLEKSEAIPKSVYLTLIKLLAPFAPHATEELWMLLGQKGSVHTSGWPEYDSKKLVLNTITVMVQVNGRVRDQFSAELGISKEEMEKLALDSKYIQDNFAGKTPARVIVVPNKIVNLVY